MFTFDRKRFFEEYRTRFGPVTQDLVDAFEVLLTRIEQDNDSLAQRRTDEKWPIVWLPLNGKRLIP